MSTNGDFDGLDLDDALEVARARVNEVANLELAVKGRDGLSRAEAHLLDFGVGQGWVTCLEYLSDVGLIDIHYR